MVIDGRSPLGRRLRDLADQLASGLGGWPALTDLQAAAVRKAAELAALAEHARAARLKGDISVTLDDVVRLDRLAEQSVRRLGLPSAAGKPVAPVAPTFAEIALQAQADAARRRAHELAADAADDEGGTAPRQGAGDERFEQAQIGDHLEIDDGRVIEVIPDDPPERPR